MKAINAFLALTTLSLSVAYAAPIRVFVSIAPEAFFVQSIGGERVKATALIKQGQSPETYTVTPGQMSALGEAKLYGTINLPFEEQLVKKIRKQYPGLKVVDLTNGVPLRTLCYNTHAHHHGHNHGAFDPHIWLNPELVKIQCQTIRNVLIEIDPDGKADYERNYAQFAQRLDTLNGKLKTILTPVRGKSLYVYHPAFGYLTEAYGIKQVEIEFEGKSPSAKYLKTLTEQAKVDHVRVVFIQPEFDTSEARSLAQAIGARVEVLDPLEYDYIESMETMALKIAKALKEESP